MRIGVFTDVHANLHAARAAVEVLRSHSVDVIVHTGDAVSIGPRSAETLDYLLGEGIVLLQGNHEISLRDDLWRDPPGWMDADEVEHERWASGCLTARHRRAIDLMPECLRYRQGRNSVVFQHAGFDADGTFVANAEQYVGWMGTASGDPSAPSMIVFGHDHRPHDDTVGRTRFVSAGSAGCTKNDRVAFGVVTLTADRVDVDLLETAYDRASTLREFERFEVPGRESILRIFYGETAP